MKKKTLWRAFRTVLIVYITGGILFYLLQDLFLFHPVKLSQNHVFQFNIPFNEVNINVEGRRNLSLVQFPTNKVRKGIVLYFHGNRRNIEHYAHSAPFFTKNGWDVWMIDYPGFGKSTGRRTTEAMNSDALRLYDLALQQAQPEEIIIYGKSLGTGVASYLASKKTCQQLILETPYYSMKELIKHYLPIYPSFLNKYSFPTNQYLKTVTERVTMIHGKKDEIIPYEHALRLKKENPKINLLSVQEGKHNTLYKFPQVPILIDSLLSL